MVLIPSVFRNSIRPPSLAMEGASGIGLGQQFMTEMFFVAEGARVMLCRLIKAEKTKSIESENKKYVMNAGEEECLHPTNRSVKRGNQYASGTLCGLCGARTSYHAKPSAKGQEQF